LLPSQEYMGQPDTLFKFQVFKILIMNSIENNIFETYGELVNKWYVNRLNNIGILHPGDRAEGAVITDTKGNSYIDCTSGYGIGNLGHNNPRVIRGLIDQLQKRGVNTRPFINKIQVELALLLKEVSPEDLEYSYLFNSGSEAVEAAIKLVRLYKGGKKIISMQHSFYGNTMGALSISGVPSFNQSFRPLLPSVEIVPFDDFDSLSKTANENTAAIFMEPIQHDAGVNIPSGDYLKNVRTLCNERNIILVFDEVITGIGKTGRMFASEYFGVCPDIMVIGKSLGAGIIPIGAILAKRDYWQRFGMSFPMTATSYGGNALACRAAIESIKFLRDEKMLEKANPQIELITAGLKELSENFPTVIRSAKGVGILHGLEITNNKMAEDIVKGMIEKKVLVYQAFGNPFVIMIEPPLVISRKQVLRVLEAFNLVLEEVSKR
jgi:putrescine aminotransferase